MIKYNYPAFSLTLLLLVISIGELSVAQIEEPANYLGYIEEFVEDFNSGNCSHVASGAAESFLKSVPEPKLCDFLGNLRRDYGSIVRWQFKNFDDRGSAVYRAEMDSAWFRMIVGLDSTNRLKRLVFLDPNYNDELIMISNRIPMRLPFESEWFVFWGGDSEDDNYHVTVRSQKNALDFVIRDSTNRSYRTDGKSNADYFAYGQNILSPCNGTIVKLIDSVVENKPGEMNGAQLTGNSVVIKASDSEFVLMAHLQPNSITVNLGDKVRSGQIIGLCGNSGNSSEPHLHMHIMDSPKLRGSTGIKCFFDSLLVNGVSKSHYSPVKGERIRSTN